MGFYCRKYVNLGPFRVNIGKSGLGYSVGGRVFRFDTTFRGRKYCLARSQRVSPVGLLFEQATERQPSRLVPASVSQALESATANTDPVALSPAQPSLPHSPSADGSYLLEST